MDCKFAGTCGDEQIGCKLELVPELSECWSLLAVRVPAGYHDAVDGLGAALGGRQAISALNLI